MEKFKDFISKTIGRIIIFWMFVLMTISSVVIMYLIVTRVSQDNIETTRHNLNMLNTSIFQTLRTAMNTGDPIAIEKAEKEASTIVGVEKLFVAKSKKLIELYSPDTKFTQDKQIKKVFDTKKSLTLETQNTQGHFLRMLKPMIATQECLMCHTNQNKGDVIGVMDLTFSLEESDNKLDSMMVSIVLISTVLGWFTIAIIYYIVNRATKPISGLKEGFIKLIETKGVEDGYELEIKSKGEIAEVSKLFNKYMKKVMELINAIDKYVITSETDKKGVMTHVSQAFCEISGYTKDELLGNTHKMLRHPDMPSSVFEDMWKTLKSGKNWEGEVKNRRKDGTAYWVHTDISPKFDEDGKINGYTVIRYDITDKKAVEDLTQNLEDKIIQRTKDLEEAKKEVEAVHKHTKESIEFASLIQRALIPLDGAMDSYFKDNFVIWTPKDIVGGDIWLFEDLRHEDECLFMFIDCTGHGVPGAFVTMIVKAVEREVSSIINSTPDMEVSPAWIMSYFNRTIKKLLRQETADSISNAGWDGGIIYYNRRTQILKFAGAETTLFYIDPDGEFKTIKGNRYSVGYKKCDIDYQYKETIIEVKEGMKFYCTTDGFLDQNGGTKDFPFGKKRFGNIIKSCYTKPMCEQREIFIQTMEEYEAIMAQNHDRNDDMTVIGFEIGSQSNIVEVSMEEIVKYEGVITQNMIATAMDNLEAKIDNMGLMGNISTVTIEYCQNMMNYSKNKEEGSMEIVPEGSIEVQFINKEYYEITASNIVSVDDKNIIEPKLIEIKSLDKAGIKKRYRELRKSGKHTHEKGGGIGLYEIAKASESIDYHFEKINEDKYYFTMRSTIRPKR